MVGLRVFNTRINFHVLRAFFESLSLDLLDIVETGFVLLGNHLDFVHIDLDVLLEPFLLDLSGFVLLLMGLRLVPDFHQLTGVVVIVLLQLLEFSSLFEQGFGGCSALVFQNLLFF